jgi:hypothetical protein
LAGWFIVFNATFNNISVISWQSVLLVEETRVPRENEESNYHTISREESSYHTISREESSYHTISREESSYHTKSREVTVHWFNTATFFDIV